MADRNFDIIVQDQFNFLKSDFRFKLLSCNREDWGYELFFVNSTTGVKITYEFREAYIFIMLYRLNNGKFNETPEKINKESILEGYELGDVINLKNIKASIKPAYDYDERSIYYDQNIGLTNYVSIFSERLKEYGSDILQGDFSIFSDLEKIVKKRIEDNK